LKPEVPPASLIRIGAVRCEWAGPSVGAVLGGLWRELVVPIRDTANVV
jgi:hypothetical protein